METRARNMEKRRARILFEARKVIAQEGFDALTTRGLAKAAGVTQPTLYNLIGSKNDILKLLMTEAISNIWARLEAFEATEPLQAIEAVAALSIRLFAEDEPYYRAAIMAADYFHGPSPQNDSSEPDFDYLTDESSRMAANAVQSAIDAGLLKGNIAADVFGAQMYDCYRSPMRDWAYGLISIDEFRTRALRGFYMVLAIDATPKFHKRLEDKISNLLTKKKNKTARRKGAA